MVSSSVLHNGILSAVTGIAYYQPEDHVDEIKTGRLACKGSTVNRMGMSSGQCERGGTNGSKTRRKQNKVYYLLGTKNKVSWSKYKTALHVSTKEKPKEEESLDERGSRLHVDKIKKATKRAELVAPGLTTSGGVCCSSKPTSSRRNPNFAAAIGQRLRRLNLAKNNTTADEGQ